MGAQAWVGVSTEGAVGGDRRTARCCCDLSVSGFSARSVVGRFWLALLLLSHGAAASKPSVVHGETMEERSEYQACLDDPSTCTILCAAPPKCPRGTRRATVKRQWCAVAAHTHQLG